MEGYKLVSLNKKKKTNSIHHQLYFRVLHVLVRPSMNFEVDGAQFQNPTPKRLEEVKPLQNRPQPMQIVTA